MCLVELRTKLMQLLHRVRGLVHKSKMVTQKQTFQELLSMTSMTQNFVL